MLRKITKGQVWVESVIYTLIFLVLMGMVLAFVTPAIKEQKDKTILQNSLKGLIDIGNSIDDIKRTGPGNSREVNFLITKGDLLIDGENDKIIFELDESNHAFSEDGTTLEYSEHIFIKTEENGKNYDVSISLDYSDNDLDITMNGEDIEQTFTEAQIPYRFMVENMGRPASGEKIHIKVYEI